MKRKFIILLSIFIALLLLPACNAEKLGSIKALTRPYIAQYECYEARYGEDDFLENYDYIRIILTDKENIEIVVKPKDGDKKQICGQYKFDTKTKKLTATIGILGQDLTPSIEIIDGKFDVIKTIGNKELVMKFKAM
jgi:hypothetical protein